MTFDPSILVQYWPDFAEGAWLTIRITAAAFVLGYALGIVIGLIALVPNPLTRGLVAT